MVAMAQRRHGSGHGIRVRGADMAGVHSPQPVIVQMHDDDFPARFFQDLASQDASAHPPGSVIPPPISHASVVDLTAQPTPALFQPVQRMLNVAMIDVACQSLAFPRVDPARVVSAGLVVRRVFRRAGSNGNPAWDDPTTHAAWMRNPAGQWNWITLNSVTEDLDPDPARRPQLATGQPASDAALAKLTLSVAFSESTTPAFVAPPATCAAIGRTVLYGVIPTASSDVADAQPTASPSIPDQQLLESLPSPLRSSETYGTPTVPLSGAVIDYHWLSDDFLTILYPPTVPGSGLRVPVGNPAIAPFQNFTTALRLLDSVFGAFEATVEGAAILNILNRRHLTFGSGGTASTQAMGDFYAAAKAALLDFEPGDAPQFAMPVAWEWLNDQDQAELLTALKISLKPRIAATLTPQGRFQDASRTYRVRIFLRLKGETANCPTELVWSDYSPSFRIAAWYEAGDRAHPPVPMPDPSTDAVRKAKPNCSFQVPGPLMGAMNNASLSNLGSGGAASSNLSLGWICGFNIPMITICAFFVLNIFLSLLNIVFFWLPFIKICIPFPMPSTASNDESPA